jgi:hypothetical protein
LDDEATGWGTSLVTVHEAEMADGMRISLEVVE